MGRHGNKLFIESNEPKFSQYEGLEANERLSFQIDLHKKSYFNTSLKSRLSQILQYKTITLNHMKVLLH